jgi:class 3 adenylate cyclase
MLFSMGYQDHVGLQLPGHGKGRESAVSFAEPGRRGEWTDILWTPMSRDTTLPTGTVTFLVTDIEGSTRLLRRIGAGAYATALKEHRELLRATFARHDGLEIGTEGDSFFVVFESASEAVKAAWEAQDALAEGMITVRMGLHTGNPHVVDGEYVGEAVHLAARIAGIAHGGQVLLSRRTSQLAGSPDAGPPPKRPLLSKRRTAPTSIPRNDPYGHRPERVRRPSYEISILAA